MQKRGKGAPFLVNNVRVCGLSARGGVLGGNGDAALVVGSVVAAVCARAAPSAPYGAAPSPCLRFVKQAHLSFSLFCKNALVIYYLNGAFFVTLHFRLRSLGRFLNKKCAKELVQEWITVFR